MRRRSVVAIDPWQRVHELEEALATSQQAERAAMARVAALESSSRTAWALGLQLQLQRRHLSADVSEEIPQ